VTAQVHAGAVNAPNILSILVTLTITTEAAVPVTVVVIVIVIVPRVRTMTSARAVPMTYLHIRIKVLCNNWSYLLPFMTAIIMMIINPLPQMHRWVPMVVTMSCSSIDISAQQVVLFEVQARRFD
jgi:hypothetical protein